MRPDFKFVVQGLHVVFDAPPDFWERFRDQVQKSPTPEFRLNVVPKHQDRIALVSHTGGTTVTVGPEAAVCQTKYYGDFEKPSEWAKRRAYSEAKLRALIQLLQGTGANCQLTAVSSVARWSVSPEDRSSVRDSTIRILGLSALAEEQADAVDFSVRVGYPSGAMGYFNVAVSWFQARVVEMPLPRVPRGGTLMMKVRDWEGRVADEGLEIRFDVNNKRGLHADKNQWSEEEILSTVGTALARMPESFEHLITRLGRGA